ncbi:MAG TPA: hypothetical protein VH276_16905 [Solirubrobacteraceae bacterium]|jgi:hypothetical protein|nr:hypothetical protein [Solirubrobacteraceae bacterium]
MHALIDPAAPSPRLAAAFMALSDIDPAPGSEPSSTPLAVLAALLATVLLAFSAPLAWMSRPAPRLPDQPAATQASKAPAVPGLDDDGAG